MQLQIPSDPNECGFNVSAHDCVVALQEQQNAANKKKNTGFQVTSPCGRVWFVPHAAVFDDYVAFLMDADKLGEDEAIEKAKEHCDIECWFNEQWSWDEIREYGRLIQQASQEDIQRALDSYQRQAGGHINNYIEVTMP